MLLLNVTLQLLEGLLYTLTIFASTLIFALPLGLVIAFGSKSKSKVQNANACKCTYDDDEDDDKDNDVDEDDDDAERRAKGGGSFDTDAFFGAALRRSYEKRDKDDAKKTT